MKIFQLLKLFMFKPLEFFERVFIIFTDRICRYFIVLPKFQPMELPEAISQLSNILKSPIDIFIAEEECRIIESTIKKKIQEIENNAPSSLGHNADFSLAKLCYGFCRIIKPDIVVETGVAYGVTSAFLLQALDKNGKGILHSIDLPPLGFDYYWSGIFIPESIRYRWRLHLGSSKRVLPHLLSELDKIELFVHDSLHSYGNMKFEFDTISSRLTHSSVLLADDIDVNIAFSEWAERNKPLFISTIYKENSDRVFGVAIVD